MVIAVDRGLLSQAELCDLYAISAQEFEHWRVRYAESGRSGL
jgi:hypothetical protein